ncbi:speckle-type POZ protein B-like [Argiope bruennichi]|uniref:speckle-type POZ protein B-like n=1 Tax=Argiope bruennichi TaxID=94029 RepID=UPI002495A15D|nr:speckle-type POZ protein B-like [Argiope bruennichi]
MANAKNTEKNAFTFIWKIENFNYYVHEEMSSPAFFVHSIDSEFVVELFCDNHQSDESMIACYLKLVRALNCESSFIELDFEFSILAIDGSPLISKEKVKKQFKEGKRRGFWDFIPLHYVAKNRTIVFLPQGTLTLQCKIWKTEGEMSETAVCFARTRIGIEQSSFVWPIEEFSAFKEGFTVPYSVRKASEQDPSISLNFQLATASSEGKKFELEFTPENVPQMSTDKNRKDSSNKTGFYDFKLSFLNASGVGKFHQEKNRLESHKIYKLRVLITEDLLNVKNGFLVDDALSLKCHFTFYKGIISEEIERTLYGSAAKSDILDSRPVVLYHDSLSACISSLKDMYKFLYDAQMFCDVKLRTGPCCFSVHKSILSAKSGVFESMFEVEMKDDILEILDVDPETLRKVINYMYTDTIDDMQLENIYRLYEAAKKYKIFTLQKKCTLILSENLNKHNACEMLGFADKHEDKNFKSFVQDFILKHKEEVTGSTAWKILEKRNTVLAEEIYRLM